MYDYVYVIAQQFNENDVYYIKNNGIYEEIKLDKDKFDVGKYYTRIILNTSQTSSPFIPVRCTEDKLKDLEGCEGHLYFTTDTQKIFMGQDNKIVQMCESKGFYYGKKEIEYDNSGSTPDPTVIFIKDEIEGDKLPEVDDLILNIDGCFYRVTDVDFDSVTTSRLTLQGSGVGPGGGSGGGESVATFIINHYEGQNKYFAENATDAAIQIVGRSGDLTNYFSMVECSLTEDFSNIFYSATNIQHLLFDAKGQQAPYKIPISNQLKNIDPRKPKVYVRAYDKYGTERSLSFNIYIITLEIATTQPKLFGVTEDSFDYICAVSGGGQGLATRKLIYELYDETDHKRFETSYELEENQSGNITRTIDLSKVSHGAYTLKVKMEGAIGVTIVSSNELTHKLLRYQEEVGQPIFTALIPERIEQYTSIPVSYLLTFGNNNKNYNVDILIGDKVETTQVLTANQVSTYYLTFDKQGTYTLTLNIDELGVSYSTTLVVTKYTGTLPIINMDRDDLKVYLTAKGRTNNAADKEFWPDHKNNNMKGSLSNFYYRTVNGWLMDNNGVDYLKVSQGAKVSFDAYSPFNVNPKTNGLTIELDFRISGVLDYDANLIECISKNAVGDIKTGFFITGNSFNYWASGKELTRLNLVEGQRIKLSYVIEPQSAHEFPMCYTYLNGIISSVYSQKESDDFVNHPQNPGYLKIDSTNGQIDIYNIRFYSSALDPQTVLNNYQATLDTLEMRQASYEENLIRNIKGDINLDLIEAENYNLQIPYVKIIGGYGAKKDMTMADETDTNIPALPVGKKDYRAIDIEIIYPKEHQNPYFKDYKDFKMVSTYDDPSLNVLNAFGKTPKKGAIMYAQGTSSLEYPVKNLRVKLKGDKFTVRPDIEPVNLVTFKADFMESAGAHNTGAGNYIDALYRYTSMKTPGQAHYDDETIVTCIKGHPCVIFWSPTGERGTFEYIGKYNFNLDKATPNPFGFKNDDTTFGYLTDGDGNLVLNDKGEKQNSIFCFEFLDNKTKVCNFLADEISEANTSLPVKDKYYDTWYGNRLNADNESVPGWTIGFESRYPEDQVGLHDADALWPLASWLNELYRIYQDELSRGLKPSDIDYEYSQTKAEIFDMDQVYYERNEDGEYQLAYPTAETFSSGEYYIRSIISSTYAMESIRRFRDEYQEYFDPDFLLAYYVITEALLMADSRVKNMMIATWGKEHRKFTKIDGTEKEVYNYIWYPIFYDMDTMLGLDNTGHINKEYYAEDTDETTFNGDEVLWKLVRDALPNEVAQFYTRAETANNILTKNGILPYFNDNQANMANETFYNEDAFYKYIDTFRNGYKDHLYDQEIKPGTGTRLYAAQGNRSMMREYFIDNRIKYLRGKYNSTAYQSGDRIEFRVNYPVVKTGELTEEDRLINASIAAVPPSGEFKFTSLKTGYAGVKIGQNGVPINKKFIGEETITIPVDISGANGTEAYMLGLGNLSDIGDLSDKYLQNFVVKTSDNRLKVLTLGNHNKDYYNPYWKGIDDLNLTGFNYLEEFNFENCGTFTGNIGLSDCSQIKTILLNGSSVSSLSIPKGGVISELRIPTTVKNINIDSHPTLNADKFTIGYFDYDKNEFVNDFSEITHISIKGTPVDSYAIARGAVLEPEISKLESYCFQDVEWEITNPEDVIIVDGEITGIKILNKLAAIDEAEGYLGFAPNGVATHAEALTGKLIVNVGDYRVNEFALYNKYHKVYTNLDITYQTNNIQEASTIKFYNSETIKGEPAYTVLTDGTVDLATLISKDGPNGVAMPTPIKPSTVDYTYAFNGMWTVAETAAGSIFNTGDNIAQADFGNYIPNKNTSFTANYTQSDRLYKVTLYDDDGETILLESELKNGSNIGTSLADYPATVYNYKAYDDEANPHNRYVLKGWITRYDFTNNVVNPEYKSLDTQIINNGDFEAYAYYEIEDARYNATNEKGFTFVASQSLELASGEKIKGYSISVKESYKSALKGSITLPSKYKEDYIKFVGDMSKMPNITDVYFLSDNQYAGIYNGSGAGTKNGFADDRKLKNVYLPKTEYFRYIGNYAFQDCLELISITDDNTDLLCDNIEEIGTHAFSVTNTSDRLKVAIKGLPSKLINLSSHAFHKAGENIMISELPSGLTHLTEWSLSYCPNINITTFGAGDAQDETFKGLEWIDKGALAYSGDSVEEIRLLKSINKLSTDQPYPNSSWGAFENYAPNLKSFVSVKAASQIVDQYGEPLTSFGDVGIPAVLIAEATWEA